MEKISNKNALKILREEIPPIIFTTISSLTAINPVWSVIFVSALGIIKAWGAFGQARINELVEFISQHKAEFLNEVLETDKFKSIFLNVLERHMKEVMEEKRQILRNYLLNVGRGVNKTFNYHTKILFILDQVTIDELKVLYALQTLQNQKLVLTQKIIQEGEPKDKPRAEPFEENYNLSQIKSVLNEEITPEELENILKSLRSYGLILAREFTSPLLGGGNYEFQVNGLSNFGNIFLDFIKK